MRAAAIIAGVICATVFASFGALAAVPPGAQAHYWVESASENQDPPVRRVRIVARDVENVGGKPYQWWEMSLEKPDGGAIGIRVLSERVPMTGPDGVGDVARYIYYAGPAECLEYVNMLTGRALLPELSLFRTDYLPTVFQDTRYTDGYANTGRLIGHVLVRSNVRPDFPETDFSSPRVLKLRSDVLLGPHTNSRDDRDEGIPVDSRKDTPYTTDDYREMISAGANYFMPDAQNLVWLRDEPVFFTVQGVHPDDFYRSNYLPGRRYMDEPAVRFGWNEWLPGSIVSPDVYANAITTRVAESERLVEREFSAVNSHNTGATNSFYDPTASWDTYAWTTYYQMMGGAPTLVYEGRYVHRGYDWNPEDLLGMGLESLDDRQQYDFFHAFLRGAARRWGGNWGTSVYPEGDVSMMVPALIRAYDQGARCLWMWNDRNLPYRRCLQVVREVNDYIKSHPRVSAQQALRSATAAVVLPKGYIVNCGGVVGMNSQALNDKGASYGDIAAAAVFEGILLSRAGVEYDYVNDYDGIDRAGYRQFVYIREDGGVDYVPNRRTKVVPEGLKLEIQPRSGAGIASRMGGKADFTIPVAKGISIDGDVRDWSSASWVDISGPDHWYGDNYRTEIDLVIPEDANPSMGQDYLGFTWDDINDSYREKYLLEGYGGNQVVVTSVRPGSAADKAGLREGDVFRYIGPKWTRWAFEVWGMVSDFKKTPGKTVHIQIQRNGIDHYGGESDLSGRFAFERDDRNLYIAVEVTDDIHQQTWPGPEFWRNDSVQIGFDPTLARSYSFGENGHEIGFALAQGRPVAWRWAGRRGQPVGEMKDVKLAINRANGKTFYEAAVPLSEFEPMAPDMWRQCGINVVVNDSDDGKSRKARIELSRNAMTAGKHLDRFKTFEFAPTTDESKLSAAVMWDRRSLRVGGAAELTVAVASPKARQAVITARLESLDSSQTKPVESRIDLPVTPNPAEFTLTARTLSQPGRYRLSVKVMSPEGRVAAEDSLPVYVYK